MQSARLSLKTIATWHAIIGASAATALASYLYATGDTVSGLNASDLSLKSISTAGLSDSVTAKMSNTKASGSFWSPEINQTLTK